jgi:hypothetical protein
MGGPVRPLAFHSASSIPLAASCVFAIEVSIDSDNCDSATQKSQSASLHRTHDRSIHSSYNFVTTNSHPVTSIFSIILLQRRPHSPVYCLAWCEIRLCPMLPPPLLVAQALGLLLPIQIQIQAQTPLFCSAASHSSYHERSAISRHPLPLVLQLHCSNTILLLMPHLSLRKTQEAVSFLLFV